MTDVRGEDLAAEADRQARLIAAADARADDQAFIEAVTAPWDEE
ncbi:MAG: DUF3018 family protein [Gordonia sp. (in: high G+C Gram-positive bacteria)]